jgi:hypothetical protein
MCSRGGVAALWNPLTSESRMASDGRIDG